MAHEHLPDDYRMVLLLASVEGFSYEEIAKMVGCPIGTVMSRIARARQSIDRALHSEGQGNG